MYCIIRKVIVLFFVLILCLTLELGQSHAIPSSYDARDDGLVTSAEYKGFTCGACWAFATVAAFESHLLKKFPSDFVRTDLDLSEQQHISCNPEAVGCTGGGSWYALRYWEDVGPIDESCCPYCEFNTEMYNIIPCESCEACQQLPYRTSEIHNIDTSDPEQVKTSIFNEGPGILQFTVYNDFRYDFWYGYQTWPDNVYVCGPDTTTVGLHYVSIIGWDDTKGFNGAYLCMNNWGEGGPNGDGTFWIAISGHDSSCNLNFQMTNFNVIKDSDADGVSNDGDDSGVEGDTPCYGGVTENCDDNCINTPNGPKSGTCTAGAANKFRNPCINNEQCGPNGFCSKVQEDSDGNGTGDACDVLDSDYDNDGIVNESDNCPYVYNTGQENSDSDQYGNACDYCISISDPDQADTDEDATGDVCDECTDTDVDGYGNSGFPDNICSLDNCPNVVNPGQENNDGDDLGNECDNCPDHYNPGQEDSYPPQGNGFGDACDCEGDFDCDGGVNAADVTTFLENFGRGPWNDPCINDDPCDGDFDCNGGVDAADLIIFLEDFGRGPYSDPCPYNAFCLTNSYCCYSE